MKKKKRYRIRITNNNKKSGRKYDLVWLLKMRPKTKNKFLVIIKITMVIDGK